MTQDLTARKAAASTWFETLRDDLCAAFEAVETDLPAGSSASPGRAPTIPALRVAAG